MFPSPWESAPASLASKTVPDAYNLAHVYGHDAATKLSRILQALEIAGFPKAHVNAYSAFDRVLSGITWLLQRIVRREDAAHGRVQWDVLFQSHSKMKPRLGFAQEVVRCIDALHVVCPVAVQPHQLLLQDFGDMDTVQQLVVWLIDAARKARHLEQRRREKACLTAMHRQDVRHEVVAPLKNEVAVLLAMYAPQRRWQYIATEGNEQQSEDALIQQCLLEYGERVTAISVNKEEKEDFTMERQEEESNDQVDCMAQLASQAAAIASGGGELKPRGVSRRGIRAPKTSDPQAADFDRQFQKARKHAMEVQQTLLNQRREREEELLLQRVVVAPEEQPNNIEGRVESNRQSLLHIVRAQLKDHNLQVQHLIEDRTNLNAKMKECHARAAALDEALSAVKLEMKNVEAQIPKDATTQEQLVKLHELVKKSEKLKREKNDVRAKCRLEIETLKERIEKLKRQVAEDANNEDDEALRLHEIEHMHAQITQKHTDMKLAAGKQTRAVFLKMKQIDEIPIRIELVQYEKRFAELYDEVALTLDETRKYYCIYNTLKTTHEFLEKEISLINSISENFDAAMSSKTATQAFFMQIENIMQGVQSTVAKQQTARDNHRSSVEKLECKYQLLLEQERTYANAIREFQKECEMNEKLLFRLEELAH